MSVPLLSADEARQAREAFDAGRPWVKIEEGDYSHMSNRIPTVGRQVYVAPSRWADLDKPCDTCGGREWTFHPNPYLGAFMRGKHCPDCRDGRRVWELRTECPTCGGGGSTGTGYECPLCGGTGQVATGRGTVSVIPVHAVSDEPHPHWVEPCIVVFNDAALYDPGVDGVGQARAIRLSPSPLPVPGRDWGVILREAVR